MNTIRPLQLAAACALAFAAALPARAGLFDDEEARARIEQMRRDTDTRLTKLEAASRGQLELANQIETLRGEIAKLRGQIETLTYELEQSQKRQKDFYVDLDNRVRKLETAMIDQQKAAAAAAQPQVDPAAETRDYESALNLFKAAKYKEALGAFDEFIKKYPQSALAPNAHYWLANSFFQVRDLRRAGDAYTRVASTWPNDPKAPDALLGLASSQQEGGDAKGARATLESLVSKYPTSQAASVAKDRLKPAATPKKK